MAVSSLILTHLFPGSYKSISTCQEITYTYRTLSCNFTRALTTIAGRYPACVNLSDNEEEVLVVVDGNLSMKRPEEIFALLSLVYGPSAFLGLCVHILGVEWYLNLTKGEGERLRRIGVQMLERKTRKGD
jgi:hypothetical protein